MSKRATSAYELLQRYTAVLQARNEILQDLRRATFEIKSALATDPAADIGALLECRDQGCLRLDSLLRNSCDGAEAAELAYHCADSADPEIGDLARTAAALHSQCEELAQDIMQCQIECETILRTRLEEAGRALRESVQRRRLDAAYGPAPFPDWAAPHFLDRQQ